MSDRFNPIILDEAYEHKGNDTRLMGRPSRPFTQYCRVPRLCGNCPEAYESVKCGKRPCKVKVMKRLGVPVVY